MLALKIWPYTQPVGVQTAPPGPSAPPTRAQGAHPCALCVASNPLNVALECRFTLGSKALMSPAYSETPDDGSLYCWMEVRPQNAHAMPLQAGPAFYGS